MLTNNEHQSELNITFTQSNIPFQHTVTHAHAARHCSESIFVAVEQVCLDGRFIGRGESCPREYVTGETVSSCMMFLNSIREIIAFQIRNYDDLLKWVDQNEELIDEHPAAWCALELALIDLFARRKKIPIEALMKTTPLDKSPQYTAVISDGSDDFFHQQLMRYNALGFTTFKLKLSGDSNRDHARLKLIHHQNKAAKIRLDANNLWDCPRSAIRYLKPLAPYIKAVEEPLQSRSIKEVHAVSVSINRPIILDESFLNKVDLMQVGAMPKGRLIPNLRVSKLGGLIRTLNIAKLAKAQGLTFILGAQVGETSLLCRAGLTVAANAGPYLMAAEGAFSDYLLETDPYHPNIKFDQYGYLPMALSDFNDRYGFGLS